MANPLQTYIENVVDALRRDYPSITQNIRVRSDRGEVHLNAENLDLELGINEAEIEWNGVTTDAIIAPYVRIRWFADRPSHYRGWDAMNLAVAIASWLTLRDISDNSRMIARDPVIEKDPLEIIGRGRFLYEVRWTDKVEVTPQFDYDGHTQGPLAPQTLEGEELGAVTGYDLDLEVNDAI